MEAKSIRNRNDVVEALNYALKMSGYIDNDKVRKSVEDSIVYCLTSTLGAFNDAEKSEQ